MARKERLSPERLTLLKWYIGQAVKWHDTNKGDYAVELLGTTYLATALSIGNVTTELADQYLEAANITWDAIEQRHQIMQSWFGKPGCP